MKPLDLKMPRNVAETLSPYFIKEATLEKTIERLKGIESAKRKIIIHVGVHPNEGTDMLVRQYASKWAEEYGATIVCQPTEETPHAIWERRKKETGGDASVRLPPDLILDEEEYADKFSFDNKDTLIISFHGTPLKGYREGASPRLPGLDIETSRYSSHPEDFNNRRHPIQFTKTEIVQGLDTLMNSKNAKVENRVREEKHQKDPEGLYAEDPLWYPSSPNILLIEYFYEGKPTIVEDPYFKAVIEEENNAEKVEGALDVRPLSLENWHRQMNIGPFYLGQDKLSDEDVARFNSVVVKDFEKVLHHLSRQL